MQVEHISLETDGGDNREYIDPTTGIGNGNDNGNDTGGNSDPLRDSGGNEFDPRIHASPNSRNNDGTFRRKRGRRPGFSQTKTKVHSDLKQSAEMLARGLMIFHTSLAAITRTPELCLAQEEAYGLSESGLRLMELYDIKPDPKVEAAILFAGQIGLVYGSRVFAIKARKANEAKERTRKGNATVHNADGAPVGSTTFTQEWPISEPDAGNLGSIN